MGTKQAKPRGDLGRQRGTGATAGTRDNSTLECSQHPIDESTYCELCSETYSSKSLRRGRGESLYWRRVPERVRDYPKLPPPFLGSAQAGVRCVQCGQNLSSDTSRARDGLGSTVPPNGRARERGNTAPSNPPPPDRPAPPDPPTRPVKGDAKRPADGGRRTGAVSRARPTGHGRVLLL